MRSRFTFRSSGLVCAALLGASLLSVPAGSAAAASFGSTVAAVRPDARPDYARVIVRFKAQAATVTARPMAARLSAVEATDVAQTRGNALGLRHAAALRAKLSLDSRTHVFVADGMSSAELARRLGSDAEIESVEVDRWWRHYATPNDPLYATAAGGGVNAGQWYLKAPDSTVVSSINAPAAWDVATGSGVVVAVLDTGVRLDHPDLAGQFLPGYDMIGLTSSGSTALAIANDGNGADNDPSDPGDWIEASDVRTGGPLAGSCSTADIASSSWHGTRVSGLIAAVTNNGLGMAGLAHGAKILPVRVLGKCGGWQSDIEAGMRWAAGLSVPGLPANPNVAKVINLSLGSDGSCSSSYQTAVNAVVAAGSVVVAAAGNGNEQGGIAVSTPANCSNVIGVGALRHAGTKVGFSNVGAAVSISAPGGNCINTTGGPCVYAMLSTTNSGTQGPRAADDAYNYVGVGTSFATPLVSATAALMLSVDPTLTPAQIRSALRSTARAFPTTGGTENILQCTEPPSNGAVQTECYCTTSTCGAGMLDANAAVLAVKPAGTGTDPGTTSSGGGGGGGAASPWWLAGLLMATLALSWPRRRRATITRR